MTDTASIGITMPITMLYAGLLGLWLFVLSVRVIRVRQGAQIGLGDGGNTQLQRRIRAHGNLVEYAPLGLLLIALAEAAGTAAWTVHLLGAALLVGRLLHGIALSFTAQWMAGRVAGMLLTFASLVAASVLCVVRALGA